MKLFLIILSLCAVVSADTVLDVAREHVTHLLSRDVQSLPKTYADTFDLLPGHQFAHEKHGLRKDAPESQPITVTKAAYMNAFRFSAARRREVDKRQIMAMVPLFRFEVLPSQNGEFHTDASRKVDTPNGKLTLKVQEGDKVVKVSPRRGHFILLQFRKLSGSWKVVAEYFS